ncbi:MAG: alpha-amylase family glycosyl hydrolase [Christensenellales bacterium]
MEALRKILELIGNTHCQRTIPGAWIGSKGELQKDVSLLLRSCICRMLQSDCPVPEGNTIKGSIYAMLPRALTATMDKQGFKSGSLLMALLYLPQLKKTGVEVIYLLPVFQTSNAYKKGEIGSPYAIRDVFQIDAGFHDGLLGEYCPELMELQFKAFVEAAHALGMRVMLDFVFRTVARDNVLMKGHPDWFYWKAIDKTPPLPVADLPLMTSINDENLERIYTHEDIKDYIAQFAAPPTPDDRWRQTVDEGLAAVEREYRITTMPAFSDVINDVQPLWCDVTYLKYDLGRSIFAKKYVDSLIPPFILYDSIKLDRYAAQEPNSSLFEYILGILPYYINTFDIDGARIDMGHALPPALNERIVDGARKIKRNFLFWSEMLSVENSMQAKKEGFDFISGATWIEYRKPPTDMIQGLFNTLSHSALPVASSLETPDTERAASLYPVKKTKLLYALNLLLPNTVPLFTNGFEVSEKQPMNLGLCQNDREKYALDPLDPFYGKLAFFDHYCFHWGNESLHSWLVYYGELRIQYYHLLDKNKMTAEHHDGVIGFCYRDEENALYAIFNMTDRQQSGSFFENSLPEKTYDQNTYGRISYNLMPYEVFTLYAGNRMTNSQ